MIRLIGMQRVLGIIVLATLTVFFVFYQYFLVTPQIQDTQRELSKNKSEVAEMTENLDSLVKGIAQFSEQKDIFELIQKYEFFDPQDRVEAGRRITKMQEDSRLLSAKYSVRPAKPEKNQKAFEAGHKILNTDIDFDLEAIEDEDIYKFVYLLNYGFPGHITITELNITRDKEVTQPLLRQIGTGQESLRPLVTAILRINWRTMVPDTSIQVTTEENNEGDGF